MSDIPYENVKGVFLSLGAKAGLDAAIGALKAESDHHGIFRALLLKKRYELGLPLVNPGDLADADPEKRKQYEVYVEKVCRDTGERYLSDGNIPQAYRYFRTLGDDKPIRAALEKLEMALFDDDIAQVAIENGVHPLRGFELTLQRHGLCRAITLFESDFTTDVVIKRKAASLLVHALYRDLVLAVGRAIVEKEGALPEDTDLVEMIRNRKWLFDDGRCHADLSHVNSVSRLGLLCEDETDLITSLSISEYGKMLEVQHQYAHHAPFEAGYADHARFARALLGQNIHETCDYFRSKLCQYTTEMGNSYAAEMIILLHWRTDQKTDALDLWKQYLQHQPLEVPGVYIESYYDLCIRAEDFERLADAARGQNDTSAWAAAEIMAADKTAVRA